jgi:hypothetical protein
MIAKDNPVIYSNEANLQTEAQQWVSKFAG